MAEHEVMWIGRKPAQMAAAEPLAATEPFAGAVTAACGACGADVQDYIAAAGIHGSWMVRLVRGGRRQRLVWNGREGRLVLEEATTAVDWTERGSTPVSQQDAAGFVAAIRALLGPPA